MEHGMFIVTHEGRFHGPFLRHEAGHFSSKLQGEFEIVPLFVPRLPGEAQGPLRLQLLENADYRAHVDGFKVDTHHVLTGLIQTIYFARRDERVLTAEELGDVWTQLYRVSHAAESLMHCVEQVIADASAENVVALRKALWRNRDSDDVDEHYADRFW